MAEFDFQVEQVPLAPGTHSWIAINTQTQDRIALPKGGGDDLVGQYPEIQDYLAANFQVFTTLIYVTQLDLLKIHPNGNADWTFRRSGAQVTVHDIPRVAASITVQR